MFRSVLSSKRNEKNPFKLLRHFFLLGCSPSNFKNHQSHKAGSFLGDDEENYEEDQYDFEWNEGVGDQIKNVCKKDQFVIYSNDECPEIQRDGNSGYDIMIGENDPNTPRRPMDIFFVLNASSSMWYYLTYVTDSNNTRFQNRFKSFISTMNQYSLDWRMFFANSDYSSGVLKGKNVQADDIIDEFKKVYGSDKKLFVLSLIILPGDTKCHSQNEDQTFFVFHHWQKTSPGNQIARLAKRTGGGNFSICLEDYSIMAKTIVTLSSQ